MKKTIKSILLFSLSYLCFSNIILAQNSARFEVSNKNSDLFKGSLNILPSLNEGIFNVIFNNATKEGGTIIVTSENGEKVLETPFSGNYYTLDLTGNNPGYYLVNLKINDHIYTKRIQLK